DMAARAAHHSRRLRATAAVLGLAAAAGCGSSDGEAAYRRLGVGDLAPEFAAPTTAGDTVSLAALRGEVVLLNIWATWCIPCRQEMPGLQGLHDRFGSDGLRVVGVSIDGSSSKDEVEQFLHDYGVTFTILRDPSERVTRAFRSIGVPETYLIGRDGRISKRWIGRFDPEAKQTVDAVQSAMEVVAPAS
ncbi:MAG: peroxiredoxin family protein, partial [Longimicrobiales bacterium]